MKTHFFLFALLFLTPAFAAETGTLETPLPHDPLQTTIHRLANGLTVYLSPYHQEPRIAAWIAVRAGAKNDPADSTGMAHYLEHMLFKGSSSLGTLDYAKEKPHLDRISALYEKLFKTEGLKEREKIYQEIDAENVKAAQYAVPGELDRAYQIIGTHGLNAHTTNEETVYVNNFPSNRVSAWAKLEAERFSHPVFRLFQTEIETVYEEKNRSMDHPERIISEALEQRLYKVHPYGQQTVLGSIEHLKNPSLAKMYAYYEKNYVPGNMALVLSGDFDRKEMLALVEKQFGSWKAKPVPAAQTWDLPKPKGIERVETRYEAEEKIIIAWPTVSQRHPDADALSVLDMLMDNAAAGIINLTLNQAKKVKVAGSYPRFLNDAGSWNLWAVPKQGQTLEQAEALLLETVDKLKAGQFNEDDIRAIIVDFEVSQKTNFESNDMRARIMTESFTQNRPWAETVGSIDRMRRVTKQDVIRAAQKYLTDNRVVAYRRKGKPELPSITKPQFTKIAIDPSRESAFMKEIAAMPVAPLEPKWLVQDRDYTITKTPSGKLYSAPNPVNDLFSLTLNFDVGSRHERNLCAALELLGLSGAGSLTAEEFKKKLYGLGTTLTYSCSEQNALAHLSGLDGNLEASVALMLERFTTPHIAEGTLKKMVEVNIGAHQDNKKNPGYIHHALGEYARRGPESTVLAELTDKELSVLDVESLKPLMRDLLSYRRRTAYIGNRPSKEVAGLIDAGRAEFKAPPKRNPVRYLKPSKPKVYFTHREMVQAQVGLFSADERLNLDHRVDYDFYSAYMGGSMSSVIWQEIREARSLAYSAGGGYSQAAHKGDENLLYGRLGCQADKTPEAAALLSQLLRFPPASEKRFREAAKSIEENYRANPIGFRAIPGSLMSWEDQGVDGGDPRPERFKKSLAYTLPDLLKFSGRFKDKVLSFYLLGHKERVDLKSLGQLGAVEEKTLEQIFPY